MSNYKNFTIDFPERIKKLDVLFKRIADKEELDVTYAIMKLCAAYVLTYERIGGGSGTKTHCDIMYAPDAKSLLGFDEPFTKSVYFLKDYPVRKFIVKDFAKSKDINVWEKEDLIDFQKEPESDVKVSCVLKIIRHALAHSNLMFGGENRITDIYLGSWTDRNSKKDYNVLQFTLEGLNYLGEAWINKLRTQKE